ncbi:hypothetical protein C8J57DRAFT_1238370 [Mycena rebaudengoi]|nr:hypothetical protein C8J57DRAFT_1238370 [Mycena rebaudengoi]
MYLKSFEFIEMRGQRLLCETSANILDSLHDFDLTLRQSPTDLTLRQSEPDLTMRQSCALTICGFKRITRIHGCLPPISSIWISACDRYTPLTTDMTRTWPRTRRQQKIARLLERALPASCPPSSLPPRHRPKAARPQPAALRQSELIDNLDTAAALWASPSSSSATAPRAQEAARMSRGHTWSLLGPVSAYPETFPSVADALNQDDAPPGQITVAANETRRITLQDHKLLLGAAGVERMDKIEKFYVTKKGKLMTGRWERAEWDVPLLVPKRGEMIFVRRRGVERLHKWDQYVKQNNWDLSYN